MLPENFVFSQNNLQNYFDCKQKFYLKEIQKLEWPSLESEPVRLQEEKMALGVQFHRMCYQYFCGIPEESIRESIESPELNRWWSAFLQLGLQVSANNQPEKAITLEFYNFRLTTHYDLLITNPDGLFTIYDWKTNLKQPLREKLAARMQTWLYPLVLQLFLENRTKIHPNPENINMIYWYPEFPERPIKFTYNRDIYFQQKIELKGILEEILHNEKEDFVLTPDLRQCNYCQFRSYCGRGIKAGIFSEMDKETEFNEPSDNES